MAEVQNPMRRGFHVTIREMEPSAFRAEYCGEWNTEDPDERELADLHLGTSIADLKVRVNRVARSRGYNRAAGTRCCDSGRARPRPESLSSISGVGPAHDDSVDPR